MLTKRFFDTLRTPVLVSITNTGGTVAYRNVTLYPHGIPQKAVEGFIALCAEWERLKIPDIDSLAYIMATAIRECTSELDLGIREIGRGAGKKYGEPAGPYNKLYYGRGFPQWTWYANYVKADKLLPAGDFVRNPDNMCKTEFCVPLAFQGFFKGVWTGVGLRHYITPGIETSYANFFGARHVVNGTDHADEIATNALVLRTALRNGGVVTQIEHAVAPVVATTPISNPAAMQPPKRGLVWDIGRWFGRNSS